MLSLRRTYNEINTAHFRGRLPSNVILRWTSVLVYPDVIAESHVHGVTPCLEKYCGKLCQRSRIHFNPHFKGFDNVVEFAMFHEMVHIEAVLGNRLLANHGPVFHRRMKQLAAKGAFVSVW